MDRIKIERWKQKKSLARKNDKIFRDAVIKAINLLPEKVREDAWRSLLFHCNTAKVDGYFSLINKPKYKGMVFVDVDVLSCPQEIIVNLILHEIAHYILKHKSPMEISIVQAERHEEEAWGQAYKWQSKNLQEMREIIEKGR